MRHAGRPFNAHTCVSVRAQTVVAGQRCAACARDCVAGSHPGGVLRTPLYCSAVSAVAHAAPAARRRVARARDRHAPPAPLHVHVAPHARPARKPAASDAKLYHGVQVTGGVPRPAAYPWLQTHFSPSKTVSGGQAVQTLSAAGVQALVSSVPLHAGLHATHAPRSAVRVHAVGEKNPSGHGPEQSVQTRSAPEVHGCDSKLCPAVHAVQLAHSVSLVALQAAAENVPAGHCVVHGAHTRSAAGVHGDASKVPGRQGVQSVHTMSLVAVHAAVRYWPAGQAGVHAMHGPRSAKERTCVSLRRRQPGSSAEATTCRW
jgi:hypothetical protein